MSRISFRYIVFLRAISTYRYKICLCVYNTALIRTIGCLTVPVRIIAVLFPFRWSLTILNTHFYSSYTYSIKLYPRKWTERHYVTGKIPQNRHALCGDLQKSKNKRILLSISYLTRGLFPKQAQTQSRNDLFR